jgi:hypothetical protein
MRHQSRAGSAATPKVKRRPGRLSGALSFRPSSDRIGAGGGQQHQVGTQGRPRRLGPPRVSTAWAGYDATLLVRSAAQTVAGFDMSWIRESMTAARSPALIGSRSAAAVATELLGA